MKLRAVLLRPSFAAALVAGASLLAYACGGAGGKGANDAHGAGAAAGTPGSGPACVDQLPVDDCVDYAIERESVVNTLEDLESARDQRSIPVGESALSSGDPVVVAAGLRLLGPFAGSNPQIADQAAPLLTSPRSMTSGLALATLRSAPKYNEIVQQYQVGHPNSEPDVDPWATAPALDYARVGFDGPYPNATPYAPCDSSISIGFASTDPVDRVIAGYQQKLGRAPVAFTEIEPKLMASVQQDYQKLAEQMKTLQEEFVRTNDPKVLEKIEALGKGAQTNANSSLSNAPFPMGATRAAAKVFVAEQVGETPVRIVVVYAEPLVARSIVMYAWGLPKYPPVPRAPKPLLRSAPEF